MKKITLLLFFLVCSFAFSQSVANYDISITTIWNSTDHTSVPGGAHWSPLAGATHKNPNDILEFGATAPLTNGIKNIAETGNTTNFENEINSNANTGIYLQQGFSPSQGNNSSAALSGVSIAEDFPYITLVSMVAPSPDWFIAVNNLNLRSGNPSVNNGWKDTFTMDVFAYDAGTDSGTDYGSGNSVTSPREPITMISGPPINGNRMATITFTYNSSTLSTNSQNNIENIKIFPNPVQDKLAVSNLKNSNIESLEIYSILGKLTKSILVNKGINNLEVNVSDLNSGMYLLKLVNEEDNSETRKLIVQ
ncbi:spondin domain-containing protein [Algibacter sp. 2305UL17-15]|uniref:T9SS type A sorting domain-containing protein n=1 Tax=Algibacter sp. 2305UL17-15 TaxID=3231268 RepID=UPI0034599C92